MRFLSKLAGKFNQSYACAPVVNSAVIFERCYNAENAYLPQNKTELVFTTTPLQLKILLSVLFVAGCSVAVAQPGRFDSRLKDSLLKINAAYKKQDSLKVTYLIGLLRQYAFQQDYEKVELFGTEAIAIAKTLSPTVLLYKVYYRLALAYHSNEKFLPAVNYYSKALETARQRNDIYAMEAVNVNLSALYAAIPDYSKALETNQEAVRLSEKAGDQETISNSYMNLGLLYLDMRNPVSATIFIKKALRIFLNDSSKSLYGCSLAYEGLGNAIQMASEQQLAAIGIETNERDQQSLQQYALALEVSLKDTATGNDMVGVIYKDIGAVYEKNGDHASALKNYTAADDFIRRKGTKQQLADIQFAIGRFHVNNRSVSVGKRYLFQSLAIARQFGFLGAEKNALELLSNLYDKAGQKDSAFFYYKQFITVKSKILDQEKDKELTRQQLEVEFAVKERDYRMQQQVTESKVAQQLSQINYDRKVKWFLVGAVLLTMLFAGLILQSQRTMKRLNRVVSDQKNELEQLGQVKDRILSVVSHDMRTPVNSVVSFIQLLDHGGVTPQKMAVYAQELKQQLQYTSTLMNNLLYWAASQMQGFKPVKEKFDAAVFLRDMIGGFQVQVRDKELDLMTTASPGIELFADRRMLEIIVRNLISNAIKYSNKGGMITLSAVNAGNDCLLSVRDNGIGMLPDALALLNASGAQPAESKRGTANEKGTGLGLALCKTLAVQMGGTLTAFSGEEGTQFEVWLPGQ